jgi:hypothetical protein
MEDKTKYTVLVDDNFHSMDESERYEKGSYDTAEQAIEVCRELTRRSLTDLYEEGITPSKLHAQWLSFGEDPFIRGGGKVLFSAREYITDELCADVIAECTGPQGKRGPEPFV